jgi:hypothetical protein
MGTKGKMPVKVEKQITVTVSENGDSIHASFVLKPYSPPEGAYRSCMLPTNGGMVQLLPHLYQAIWNAAWEEARRAYENT